MVRQPIAAGSRACASWTARCAASKAARSASGVGAASARSASHTAATQACAASSPAAWPPRPSATTKTWPVGVAVSPARSSLSRRPPGAEMVAQRGETGAACSPSRMGPRSPGYLPAGLRPARLRRGADRIEGPGRPARTPCPSASSGPPSIPHVALVTLDRPEKANALDPATLARAGRCLARDRRRPRAALRRADRRRRARLLRRHGHDDDDRRLAAPRARRAHRPGELRGPAQRADRAARRLRPRRPARLRGERPRPRRRAST